MDLEGAATQADFGEFINIRNWDANDPYNYDSHSIVPQGVYVRSENGDLEAGILARYNGADLSPGDHYLIVETFSDTTRILKYLILYGDTLEVTKAPLPEVAIKENLAYNDLMCYPNPYTHQTRVVLHVDDPGQAILRIYDHTGKTIRVLLEGHLKTGEYDVIWEGKDDQNLNVSPGLYILDCIFDDHRTYKKILKL